MSKAPWTWCPTPNVTIVLSSSNLVMTGVMFSAPAILSTLPSCEAGTFSYNVGNYTNVTHNTWTEGSPGLYTSLTTTYPQCIVDIVAWLSTQKVPIASLTLTPPLSDFGRPLAVQTILPILVGSNFLCPGTATTGLACEMCASENTSSPPAFNIWQICRGNTPTEQWNTCVESNWND